MTLVSKDILQFVIKKVDLCWTYSFTDGDQKDYFLELKEIVNNFFSFLKKSKEKTQFNKTFHLMSDYKDTSTCKAFPQPFQSLEKVILKHGSVSLCEILNIWNTIISLWASVMAKLRYIQIHIHFIETKKCWNLFSLKKRMPSSLKELLLILP